MEWGLRLSISGERVITRGRLRVMVVATGGIRRGEGLNDEEEEGEGEEEEKDEREGEPEEGECG